MIGYPITYGDELRPEEACKRLTAVSAGLILVIGFSLLLTKAAYAADAKPSPPGTPGTPGTPGPLPAKAPGKAVSPVAPSATPTNQRFVNAIGGMASSVCANAITEGDFWLGVVCGFLVVFSIKMAEGKWLD